MITVEKKGDAAQWIWSSANRNDIHQYCWFGREFQTTGTEHTVLRISTDSDFIVYCNGAESGRSQFPDHQHRKSFTDIDLSKNVRHGNNILLIYAYHCGENFFSHQAAPAGVWAELQCGNRLMVTDSSWRCCHDPVMKQGPIPKVTFQLGFTTQADLRKRGNFQALKTVPENWTAAFSFTAPPPLMSRPVKPLHFGTAVSSRIIQQGRLIRFAGKGTFAELAAEDYLQLIPAEKFFAADNAREIPPVLQLPDEQGLLVPGQKCNGIYLTIDLGQERVGLLRLRVLASAGTVIDIAHGEHLDDGRVRCRIGERNFADRLICGNGISDYELPFRRLGARYLELHIPDLRDDFVIYEAGIRPVTYPLDAVMPFKCSDFLAERLDELSIRTLQLCMLDHYEDCPWREQGLYAYDSRNQALYGYPLWGNYDYAAASLRLLGEGLRQDGWLELCAPARIGLTIPIFSFAWISAIHDYYLHSGRLDLYNYFSGQLKSMMNRYSGLYDECSGLYRLPSGDDLWHFYEWVDGLNRTDTAACPITGAPQEMHSLFNLYWLETLNAYAGLCAADNADDAQHYNRRAEKLKSAIHRGFFNEKRHGYASFTNNDGQFGWHLHTQILALRNGVVPDDCRQALIDNIINGDFIRITYSAMPYLVQAMMPCSQDARVYVANLINKNYSIPVFQGATSMWETDQGSAAFSGAGSLCHGWSSLPAYYYRAWVLGVRPLSPGYCTFSISPCCGSFQSACGEIMTPSGVIRVQWTRHENGISLELNGPQNLTPVYLELPEVKVATIIWNGKNIKNPMLASPRNSRDREPEIQKTLELNQ